MLEVDPYKLLLQNLSIEDNQFPCRMKGRSAVKKGS
jgi:hypothetical protein